MADQAHPAVVCTANDPWPPAGSIAALPGEIVNVQPWPWLTVKVRPAIVTEPERLGPVVEATDSWTVPLPVPWDPDVTVIHGELLAAVHGQPEPAATVTDRFPPAAGTAPLSGVRT